MANGYHIGQYKPRIATHFQSLETLNDVGYYFAFGSYLKSGSFSCSGGKMFGELRKRQYSTLTFPLCFRQFWKFKERCWKVNSPSFKSYFRFKLAFHLWQFALRMLQLCSAGRDFLTMFSLHSLAFCFVRFNYSSPQGRWEGKHHVNMFHFRTCSFLKRYNL